MKLISRNSHHCLPSEQFCAAFKSLSFSGLVPGSMEMWFLQVGLKLRSTLSIGRMTRLPIHPKRVATNFYFDLFTTFCPI